MAVLLQAPYNQFLDDDGNPLTGGFVYSYEAGTDTPKATYTDYTGGTPATNPVELDAAGRANIWIEGDYKFTVKDADGVTIRTVDHIEAIDQGGDMTKAVYDPANIAQQVVGTTAVQTVSNKTLTAVSSVTFASGSSGGLIGTTTNDSAATGSVGEYVTASLASGSATSLVSNTAKTVTSISLTAGDWDVNGVVSLITGGTTTTTAVGCGISTTNNTLPTLPDTSSFLIQASFATNAATTMQAGVKRISISGTTTVYLIAYSVFATSTCTAYGMIQARRVR